MTVTIHLSPLLHHYCGGGPDRRVQGASVREVFAKLELSDPKLYASVCDETGSVRPHVNVFVNVESIRDLQGLDTRLVPGDTITILQAVSGG
ncbi:MAG: MoaD/ThiS family protein [Planctomycetes bacterium]|nr:MoaD/ThiS family protein [Planctomycetota bacterium]